MPTMPASPERSTHPVVEKRFGTACTDVVQRERRDDGVGARQRNAHEISGGRRHRLLQPALRDGEDLLVIIDSDDVRGLRARQAARGR